MIFIVMILKNVKRNQQLRSWRESIEKGQGKKEKEKMVTIYHDYSWGITYRNLRISLFYLSFINQCGR